MVLRETAGISTGARSHQNTGSLGKGATGVNMEAVVARGEFLDYLTVEGAIER